MVDLPSRTSRSYKYQNGKDELGSTCSSFFRLNLLISFLISLPNFSVLFPAACEIVSSRICMQHNVPVQALPKSPHTNTATEPLPHPRGEVAFSLNAGAGLLERQWILTWHPTSIYRSASRHLLQYRHIGTEGQYPRLLTSLSRSAVTLHSPITNATVTDNYPQSILVNDIRLFLRGKISHLRDSLRASLRLYCSWRQLLTPKALVADNIFWQGHTTTAQHQSSNCRVEAL